MLACAVSTAQSETLVVNNAADDGSPHTLRWAILKNNAEGGNRIQINPTGNPHGEFVIRLDSLLPPIKGPAVVIGRRGSIRASPRCKRSAPTRAASISS